MRRDGQAQLRLQVARDLGQAVLDRLLGHRVELRAGAAEMIGDRQEDELRVFLAQLKR